MQGIQRAAVAAGALALFLIDVLSPMGGAIAVLYVAVILFAAPQASPRGLVAIGGICAILTLGAFLIDHFGQPLSAAYTRLAVSLTAIAVVTLLSLRNERANLEKLRSEHRYGAIFDAVGFATWESDWSACIRHIQENCRDGLDLRACLEARPEIARTAMAKAIMRRANRGAVELFGAPSREALNGANVAAYFAPQSEPAMIDIVASLLEGERVVAREVDLIVPDGRIVNAALRVTLLEDGVPWPQVLVMALDVTERNETRARLEQLSAELAHAARVSTLGQLAASIAHEVNQPLAAIITYGKSGRRWLQRPQPVIDEALSCFDNIVDNGARTAQVINRIRAMARNTPPRTEPIDLRQLVDETQDLVLREARTANVIIKRTQAPDLPQALGDRIQVQQVLVNLLMNAIQAMESVGDRPRELGIHLHPADHHILVSVSDTGPGISGDNPTRIFEPFFTTKGDGMGMGLSICRSIIESQGGAVRAQNNAVVGATISFTLPAHCVPV